MNIIAKNPPSPEREVIIPATKLLLPALLLVVCSSGLKAHIIHVPADSSTIQSGINGTADGDTVMVSPGTYHEYNIDYLGKSIVVTSTDPLDSSIVAKTIIDADSLGHIFYFHLGEDSRSILTGLTIRGGYTDSTGGVSCFSSSPTISHNIIEDNAAGFQGCGGGISCWSSSSTIAHNIITNNTLGYNGRGGGIFCESSTVYIENNIISDNTAGSDGCGGGIACLFSTPIITGNIISGNHVNDDGGGIFYQTSPAIITENTITNNRGGTWGGGIACKSSSEIDIRTNMVMGNTSTRGGGISVENITSGSITNNFIVQNTAWIGGGIICHDYSSPIISNNTLAGNLVHTGGGGMACNVMCRPILTDNTIAFNIAEKYGGGIDSYASSHMVVSNTILWGNDAPQGPEIKIGSESDSSSVTINFSDVQGGEEEAYILSRSAILWEQGMIDAAPLFVCPEEGDFHLMTDSPCIDSGDPESDVPQNGGDRIDIGAFEYEYNTSPMVHLDFENTPTQGCPDETVGWDFTVENLSVDFVTFDGWVAVNGPKSSIMDSVLDITIPPGTVYQGNVSIYIPPCAPLGNYVTKGYLGVMHEEIWDGEVFDGEVIENSGPVVRGCDEDDWKIRFKF